MVCSHLKPIQITKLRLEMDCSSKKIKQKEKKNVLNSFNTWDFNFPVSFSGCHSVSFCGCII